MAVENPRLVWERLSETGLFPFITRSPLGGVSSSGNTADINSGLVGALQAEQECVGGEYPLTSAFLDLLLACVEDEMEDGGPAINGNHPTAASVIYLIQDVLPSSQQWFFQEPAEKFVLNRKILALCGTILATGSGKLRDVVRRVLRLPVPMQTVMEIVGTGDRVIQSCIERQATWDFGLGNELSALVAAAMTVFETILSGSSLEELGDLNHTLCSPASGRRAHFLLTISHYIYHPHSCDLPVSAMRLLSTIARMFPMSLLACLGGDAEAVKDALIYRLGSLTENAHLKIAIVDFFSACIDRQPGMIQLLIGESESVTVVNNRKEEAAQNQSSSKEQEDKTKKEQEQPTLVCANGCLTPIAKLLGNKKKQKTKNAGANSTRKEEEEDALQLSIISFVLNLWTNQRVLAIGHLKREDSFWKDLTWSLFDKGGAMESQPKLNANIFRILSSEIYTFGGKVDRNLIAILEKLCDEKSQHLSDWCSLVLGKVEEIVSSGGNRMELDNNTTLAFQGPEDKEEEEVFSGLLGAWKGFLIILSRDQPVSINPGQCHMIASALIKAIRKQMSLLSEDCRGAGDAGSAGVGPRLRIVTSMSELCLVLMQRWQTKCADNMEDWCKEQVKRTKDIKLTERPFPKKVS